ncbi:MAG: hypothetical protein JO129_04075 [Candidatus Dependentiae bacterium]|nr:hypothetical protein [Candidatus Dependentiae bacterium]
MADKKQSYKNRLYSNPEKSYLQTRLTASMPLLMMKVVQAENGKFLFSHPTFPDLRVEGLTIGFVEEHLERMIRKQLRDQSDKHIDYLLNLLTA